jgi:hypothetical protein
MSNTWSFLVGGGIALASSLIGFAGALLTSRNDLEKARLANRNELDKLRHELSVRLLELEEPHRQHRAGVYHDFLDVLDRLHNGCGGVLPFAPFDASTPIVEQDSASSWFHRHDHCRNAVLLFGDRSIRAPLDHVSTVVQVILQAVQYDMDTGKLLRPAAYREDAELQRRMIFALEGLVAAMRDDLDEAATRASAESVPS